MCAFYNYIHIYKEWQRTFWDFIELFHKSYVSGLDSNTSLLVRLVCCPDTCPMGQVDIALTNLYPVAAVATEERGKSNTIINVLMI